MPTMPPIKPLTALCQLYYPSHFCRSWRIYRQPGDTIYRIANRYGLPVADLQAANKLYDYGASIYPGQLLVIPGLPPAVVPLWPRPALPIHPVGATRGGVRSILPDPLSRLAGGQSGQR